MWSNFATSRLTDDARQDAIKGRDDTVQWMTPAQIADAERATGAHRLARAWDAAHPREPVPVERPAAPHAFPQGVPDGPRSRGRFLRTAERVTQQDDR